MSVDQYWGTVDTPEPECVDTHLDHVVVASRRVVRACALDCEAKSLAPLVVESTSGLGEAARALGAVEFWEARRQARVRGEPAHDRGAVGWARRTRT